MSASDTVVRRPEIRTPAFSVRRTIALPALLDRRDAVSLALLALFCGLLLRRSLGGGAMMGWDLFNYFYPSKVFAWETLRSGEFPLWNPYVFFGVPFLANIQMAVLYPPNLLFGFLNFSKAVAASQWLHLSLAAAGMYFLCRRAWQLNALASLFGAVAYAGSGFFAAHMGHLNQIHASVWLPWVALAQARLASALSAGADVHATVLSPVGLLAFLRRTLADRRVVLLSIGGGVAVALQLTAGHTQEAYYSLFSLGLLAGGYTLFPPAGARLRLAHLAAYALTVANGAWLAAAQLVPTLELTRHSYRQGGVPLDEAVAFGVERTHILETVLPTFWSLPSQEVTGYVGMVALVLAVPAVALAGRRRTVLALLGLAILALTLSMGTYTPLYALLHRWLPQFDSFRAPGRWLLIWTFALAGLGAHGAHALRYRLRGEQRERAAFGYGVTLFLVAAGLLFAVWRTNEVHAIQWLPHGRIAVLWLITAVGASALGLISIFSRLPWPRMLLVGALALELGFASREMEYNRPGDASLYQQLPAVATYIQDRLRSTGQAGPMLDRVVSLAVEERLDGERLRRAVPEGDGEHRRYAAMREVLRPNHGATMGLPSIDGYDGGLLPLRDYARFKALLVRSEPPVPHFTLGIQAGGKAESALFGALNVRYLLTDGRSGAPGPGWILREGAPGAAWLYENAAVLPRAFLVGQTVVESDPEKATEMMRTIDLAKAAVVERPLLSPSSSNPVSSVGTVQWTAAKTGTLEMRIDAHAESVLVLTETFYPGWRATLNGQSVPIHRANVLFRGIVVPVGIHHLRLWYDPLTFKIGVGLTFLAVMGNAAALWWAWSKTRREMHRAG